MRYKISVQQGGQRAGGWEIGYQVFNGFGMAGIIATSLLGSSVSTQMQAGFTDISGEHVMFLLSSIFTLIWFFCWAMRDLYKGENGGRPQVKPLLWTIAAGGFTGLTLGLIVFFPEQWYAFVISSVIFMTIAVY